MAEAAIDAFVLGASVWRHLGMPVIAFAMIREAQRVGFYSVFDRLRHYEVITVEEDE